MNADEGLLHGDDPFQHAFHGRIITAVANPAHIKYPVAGGYQRVDPRGIVTDDTASGRFGPTAETATQWAIFNDDRST